MPLNTFLAFFSLSSRMKHLDEETDRAFFSWFKNEFIPFRPGYMYQSEEISELHEKYRLLILNMRVHGRVLDSRKKETYETDSQQASAIPDELAPHIFFSVTNDSGISPKLTTTKISEIKSDMFRSKEFNNLSMRYGLKISKKQLYEKIALIGKASQAASEYFPRGEKLLVEIFDPYYDPLFLCKLLSDSLIHSRHLSLKIHFCDLAVLKRIDGIESMRGPGLKTACQKAVKAKLREEWLSIQEGIIPALRNLWLSSRNLRLYHWQPKNSEVSGRVYEATIRNSFHRRLIRIDNKYYLKSDHSFHVPRESGGEFDEPVGFSHENPEEFTRWADQREFEAQRLLINGQPCFSPD